MYGSLRQVRKQTEGLGMEFHLSKINDVDIVKVEQAFSPLHTEEVPKPFRNVAKLTLADNQVVYGCRFDGCDYTSTAPQGINAHFATHKGPNSKRWGEVGNWTVAELFDTVLDFEAETARLHRLLASAQERALSHRDEAQSLRNKLARRDSQIASLNQRLAGLQVQWRLANEKARGSKPTTSADAARIASMEETLNALAEQVQALTAGRVDN